MRLTLPRGVEVFVPTRDSARWIGAFAHAWKRIGVSPLYVVDARTRDRTSSILRDLGMRQIDLMPEHDRVEDIVWRVGKGSTAEWLLRLDDDEFPSTDMLGWIRRHVKTLDSAAVGFSRRWCWTRAGRLAYAVPRDFFWLPESPDQLDPQIRLFRPAIVRWTTDIHTPGFAAKDISFAPPFAYLCHFDWMMRSRAERNEKIARYEAQQPGAGNSVAEFYLPEERAAKDSLPLQAFETREFERLAKSLLHDRALAS